MTQPGKDGATLHKIRLASKVEALKVVAQHLGLLKVKVEVPGDGAIPVVVVHQQLPDDDRPGPGATANGRA
jgi:hypothetical protein